MEWRPIETAPKDGTAILVWRAHEPGRELRRMGIDMWVGGCWWNSRRDMQPTHWQPLPAPPKDTAWIDAAAVSDFNDES